MKRLYPQLASKSAAAVALILICSPLLAQQNTLEGIARIKVSETLATQLEARTFTRSLSGEVVTGIQSLDRLNHQFKVRRFTRVFPHAGRNEPKHRKHGLHLWYEVTLDRSIPVSQMIQSYLSDKQILKVEPVYEKALVGSERKTFGTVEIKHAAGSPLADASNDPLLETQWNYNNTGQTGGTPGADISLFDAWKIETGSKNVIVAITDGGVQTDHPDLAANLWVNTDEIARNNVDDDNNGYVDDIHGYSFVSKSGDVIPDNHGTHVAGTIAAVNNNGLGVAGIAGGSGSGDGVRLMACAVFDGELSDGFAQAYVYSADNGAIISQNSWGYTTPGVFEQVVIDAIDYFIAEAGKDAAGKQTGPMNGGLVIFSAGNQDAADNYYPAFYEPVIAVSSTTHKDVKAGYSNYGPWVDISAPGGETYQNDGEGVVSTLAGNKYGSFMGTSMACPHVSGVAALILSKFSRTGLTAQALRKRLLQSVDDINARNDTFNGQLGSGRLNAVLALRDDDGIAPQRVDDLRVADNTIGTITLAWTSPKDPGDVVAEYDLRYATAPITEKNFKSATAVPLTTAPGSPGSMERFAIEKLPGGVTFYFALRSRDFHGNTSALSNVVRETSSQTPTIAVSPGSIAEKLQTAARTTRSLTIANKGKGQLTFHVREPDIEAPFASAAPVQGVVAPGSTTAVNINLDASGLMSGTYRQDIIIESNDPAKNIVTVPIALQVTNNGAPIASLSEDTVDFKTSQIGTTAKRRIVITNRGSHALSVTAISGNTKNFYVQVSTPLTIDPFQGAEMIICFSPTVTGPVADAISIVTNDPVNPILVVRVQGEGLQEAPVLISPDSFHESLLKGTKTVRVMRLQNNGSQDRNFRLQVLNTRLADSQDAKATGNGRVAATDDSVAARLQQMRERHRIYIDRMPASQRTLASAVHGAGAQKKPENASGRMSRTATLQTREYATGFENFPKGPPVDEGWFTTRGWTVVSENPDNGSQHLRGFRSSSEGAENIALSPYLFEYDEFNYPQYTTTAMRLNFDIAKGAAWEIVPQDPWSYVATRVRFNADGTIEAMVIDNDYAFHWKKLATPIPSGYFDLALEYNSWGTDTSGFPTYDLFINNEKVFSGTGLGSGIGQVAFIAPAGMEGPLMDVDEFKLLGGEYVPLFVRPDVTAGTLPAGESVNINVAFDASVMKYGSYASDIVVRLDEADSLAIPATLTVTGEASVIRDLYGIYMELNKGETGTRQMTLKNTGGTPVSFNLALKTSIEGFALYPSTGTIPVRGEQSVNIQFGAAPGIYENTLLLSTGAADSSPEEIPVDITVFESEAIFTAPEQATFDIRSGQISTHTISVRNDGKNTVSFKAEVPSEQSWISLDPSKATFADSSFDISIQFDAREVSAGIIKSMVLFRSNDLNRPEHRTSLTLNVLPDTKSGGFVGWEKWTGIPGKDLADIPVDAAPTYTTILNRFESPANSGDNYGSRIRGFVHAPVDGYYTFYLASNDNSALWLSKDEREENKERIAFVTGYTNALQWNKFSSQTSSPVYLEANHKYYIEALHKEGVGSDHLAVGWRLPDGTLERPLPGMRLFSFDSSGNQPPVAACSATGTITRAYWTGIPGSGISDIPVSVAPDGIEVLTAFEGPVNVGSHYGARINGYLCPPITGDYFFWIASNDHSELWLSTDDNPMNKVKIALVSGATATRQWDKFTSQKSLAIPLIKGKRYYVEALHKQGVGTDHLAVGWQLPDGTLERPITASRLSPFMDATFANEYISQSQFYTNRVDDISIAVYPNPVKGGHLNIRVQNLSFSPHVEKEISIRRLTGLSVYSKTESCVEDCSTELDISNYEPGIYILHLRIGAQTFTEKLIIGSSK